mmetsp:Transcript_15714/g.47677  ORF Transcript_15714/g.47677 Transcript_15714/m.47677 type:complete len:207 (-) Transcript_15714:3003-3623(-)
MLCTIGILSWRRRPATQIRRWRQCKHSLSSRHSTRECSSHGSPVSLWQQDSKAALGRPRLWCHLYEGHITVAFRITASCRCRPPRYLHFAMTAQRPVIALHNAPCVSSSSSPMPSSRPICSDDTQGLQLTYHPRMPQPTFRPPQALAPHRPAKDRCLQTCRCLSSMLMCRTKVWWILLRRSWPTPWRRSCRPALQPIPTFSMVRCG